MQSQYFATSLICCNTDFNTALGMVKILVQHAAKVFDALPADIAPQSTNNPKRLTLGNYTKKQE
jgi:hypothetical protein